MKPTRTFLNTRWSEQTIRKSFEAYLGLAHAREIPKPPWDQRFTEPSAWMEAFAINNGYDQSTHDDAEEFFADFRAEDFDSAYIDFRSHTESALEGRSADSFSVEIIVKQFTSRVTIGSPERRVLTSMMGVFEQLAPGDAVPPAPIVPVAPPRLFIGHGRSRVWMDLKNHLSDQHHYHVVAYETGARSGHTIRDVLSSMLKESSFAIVIMTGEDQQEDGSLRARQNVIHEAGLFQGRLGFPRVAILMEEGVDSFSNIDGVQYIPFRKDNIRETYGDVLAALRREFPI